MFRNFIIITLLTIISFISYCTNKNNNPVIPDKIRIVKQNLHHVWEILWGPDNHIWFTERDGKISKMNPATGNIVFSTNINEVSASGEGGHPPIRSPLTDRPAHNP